METDRSTLKLPDPRPSVPGPNPRVLGVVREVLLEEPWQHSREGLDDECNYCGGWYMKWKGSDGEGTSEHAYQHLAGCVWMKWAPLVGFNMDGHSLQPVDV